MTTPGLAEFDVRTLDRCTAAGVHYSTGGDMHRISRGIVAILVTTALAASAVTADAAEQRSAKGDEYVVLYEAAGSFAASGSGPSPTR